MKNGIIFVGLDVHKNSIDVALADQGRNAEVRHYGSIGGDLDAVNHLAKTLSLKYEKLYFVYEAGPCGYEIFRSLTDQGFDCAVCSPAHIPKNPASRIKTDRRDALMLARLHRAGELTYVFVPRPEDEAMRDLTRAREDAKKAERVAKQQLSGMLLRLGIRYPGKHWSKAHFNWLANQKMATPAQQVVFQEYIQAIRDAYARVARLTQQIELLVPAWSMAPVVNALQALRGVSLIVAVTTIAELGDLTRFKNPKKLMAFLGLVPSEHSSGEQKKRGGITKTGNNHVRRVLIEGAQAYSHPARVTRQLLKRHEGLSSDVLEIAWSCQVRLCSRYRRLINAGKNRNTVITAIARELAAFMWSIAQKTPIKI
jgi:transposase